MQLQPALRLALSLAASASAASTCRAVEAPAKPGVSPGIVPGWPVLLRGGVTGAPVVADVDGDGKFEIVAPAMVRDGAVKHAEPSSAPQMWAFHADGSLVENWPITLHTVETQEAARQAEPGLGGNWYSSPSVCDVDGDGAHEVIIGLPHTKERHVVIVYGDGSVVPISNGGEPWSSVPVFDLDKDGVPDILGHDTALNVRGGPIKGWPLERRPQMIYQPAIADMDGDGEPEVFVPTFQNDWHLPGMPPANRMEGLDSRGNRLAGWPHTMPTIATYVSLGDIVGDSKKEVVAVDHAGNLHLWTHDGKPAVPGSAVNNSDASIVRAGLGASAAPPCLADLDGDGRAEILLLDRSQAVLILRGDGTPFLKAPVTSPEDKAQPRPEIKVRDFKTKQMRTLDPKNADDLKRIERIVRLTQRVREGRTGGVSSLPLGAGETGHFAGVTAVDLGGDGVMDIFAGTTWLQLGKDGTLKSTPLLSEEERGQARNNASCSVFDWDGDGRAEVVFGLTDGRLFLFRTGMTLKPEHAQWPTVGADMQHTGAWHKR